MVCAVHSSHATPVHVVCSMSMAASVRSEALRQWPCRYATVPLITMTNARACASSMRSAKSLACASSCATRPEVAPPEV